MPSFFGFPVSVGGLAALLAGFLLGGAALRLEAAEEFRGVWVVRHSLTSRQRIQQIVETARHARFNALLVQVRGRGDAYYRSRLAPRGEDLPSNDPNFDPLALAIHYAHRAGLEVHAWFNVYLTWGPTDRPPQSSAHVLLRHPEWFMASADGIDMGRLDMSGVDLTDRGVEGRYLSPGVPEVRTYLLRVIEEIVRGYDIDGLHLDYVRYPNGHYDYNLIGRAEFVRSYRFDPLDLVSGQGSGPSAGDGRRRERRVRLWERWRTDQVSLLVGDIRRLLVRLKPWVKLSAAVKPDFLAAYRRYGQDWIGWINRRQIDFVVPMFYVGSTKEIGEQIEDARKYVKKGHLYAGIGAYNQPASETIAQVQKARRLGLKGIVLFSYQSLTEQPGAVSRLRGTAFRKPSGIPRMSWKQERKGAEAKTR